jgi:hypothetical protein
MAVATSEALGSSFKDFSLQVKVRAQKRSFSKRATSRRKILSKDAAKKSKEENVETLTESNCKKLLQQRDEQKRCCDEGLTRAREEKKSGAKKDQGLNRGALDASTPSDHHRNPIFPPRTNFLDWDLGRPIGGKSSREERKHRVNRAKDDMGLMPRMVYFPRGESSLVIHVVCQSWMKTELASWHGELPAWPLKFSALGQEGFGPWGSDNGGFGI